MTTKMQKALDLNKLFDMQRKGKLLNKHMQFPMMASIKFDGNYTVIIVQEHGVISYHTSGGHEYTNNDKTVFDTAPEGVYMAERIAGEGVLGDRRNCALRGSKGHKIAHNHSYKVFDYMSLDEYKAGKSNTPYRERHKRLWASGLGEECIAGCITIGSQVMLDAHLKDVTSVGYEGLMLRNPDSRWLDTKSRTTDLVKYKKRATADLIVKGVLGGEGKYAGMIGSLLLLDSRGISVKVGSGLSDIDRGRDSSYFIGKVVEIEYEQIIDTYIQPTFIQLRTDKIEKDID